MGMLNYCIQDKNKCLKIREILLREDNNNNKQNQNTQNYNLMTKIIEKYIMHYYFKKLKNYHKTIGNEDKESEPLNNNEEIKSKEEQNQKVALKMKENTSEKEKEHTAEVPNVEEKDGNNNDNDKKDNTNNNINKNEINKSNTSQEKEKSNVTPKGEPGSTPTDNYDKSLIPRDLIFNFNDIPLNDEIAKVENDLGEFIIDQKELLKYIEQYPYAPKSFSMISFR